MSDLPPPPAAARIPLRREQLGRVRTDDYAWMEDDNWQKVLRDPSVLRADVRAHLTQENAYTAAVLASTEALQAEIVAEIRGRMKEDDSSLPAADGPWDYRVRYETGGQHPIHVRTPRGAEGPEEVLLDIDRLAAEETARGASYFDVVDVQHTDDHARLGYAADLQGSEYCRI